MTKNCSVCSACCWRCDAAAASLSTSWQKVEFTFNVADAADVTNACLKIMCTENNPDVCFKDASLVHTK